MLDLICTLIGWLVFLALVAIIAVGFLFALAAGVLLLLEAATKPIFWLVVGGTIATAAILTVTAITVYILYREYKKEKH